VARFAVFALAALSGCGLFPSLDGLGASDAGETEASADGGGDSSNDVVTHPFYERVVTIENLATAALPAGTTIGVPFPQSQMQTAIDAGKMRSDLGDLRVRGAGGERDRLVDAAPLASVVWFSLAAPIAAGATDTSYAITYGDPNAGAPQEDGAKVFDFYDDFAGASVDASKWMTQGTMSVSGGVLTLPAGGQGALTTLSLPPPTTVEWRAQLTDPTSDPDAQTGYYYWFGFQRNGDFVPVDPWIVWIARDKGLVGGEDYADGCASICSDTPFAQNASFRFYGIERQPSQTVFSIDGAPSYTTPATNDQALSLMIRNFLVTSDLSVDWIRARARVYPEPTVTLGAEQTL
jgi:hypothetical protein